MESCVYFSPGDLKKRKKAVSWTTPALQLSIPRTAGLPQSLRTTDYGQPSSPEAEHPSAPARPARPARPRPVARLLPAALSGTPSHAERTGKLPGSAEGSPGPGPALLRPGGAEAASGRTRRPAPPAPARPHAPAPRSRAVPASPGPLTGTRGGARVTGVTPTRPSRTRGVGRGQVRAGGRHPGGTRGSGAHGSHGDAASPPGWTPCW